jgi:hypothetical protein
MSNLFFWIVWFTVSAFGIKYSAKQLLNEDISIQASLVIMFVYQWIRFIKPTDKVNTSKTLPPPNTSNKSKSK